MKDEIRAARPKWQDWLSALAAPARFIAGAKPDETLSTFVDRKQGEGADLKAKRKLGISVDDYVTGTIPIGPINRASRAIIEALSPGATTRTTSMVRGGPPEVLYRNPKQRTAEIRATENAGGRLPWNVRNQPALLQQTWQEDGAAIWPQIIESMGPLQMPNWWKAPPIK